jgi:enoyl-CoA hydratase
MARWRRVFSLRSVSTRQRSQAPTEHTGLRVAINDRVADVELRGSGQGNAMGAAVWRELPAVFDALGEHEGVRAVVLRGAGEDFSVGLDLRWYLPHYRRMMRSAASPAAARRALLSHAGDMQSAVDAVAGCRAPVIAAVDGACVGAGLDLAAACDLRYATRSATFSVREVRIAVVADLGVLQRLPRIIGDGHTRELALTGRDFDGVEAERIGLVSRSFVDRGCLFAAAAATAREIADNPPAAVAGVKRVLADTRDLSVDHGLRHSALWNAAFMSSPELDEAFDAFRHGRHPDYSQESAL